MPELTSLFSTLVPALPFLVLPFLASTVAALVCAAVHSRLKTLPARDQAAGDWLSARTAEVPVAVGVAPEAAGSMDGYWPESRFIGLSPRTWTDRTPAGRAIAAHEFGHASAWHETPQSARGLMRLRKAHAQTLAIGDAGLLTATFTGHALAFAVWIGAWVLGLAMNLAVLADEADASVRGAQFLESHGERSTWTDVAMLSAFGVYFAPFVSQIALFGALPFLLPYMETPAAMTQNAALGLWAILLLAPFLLLRALQVISDTLRPAPITTEFRLNWTLFQERTWGFHSGVIVLLWLALTHDQPVSEGLAPLYLLGAIPAMGPLGALGRMVVVLPLFFILAAFGFFKQPSPAVRSIPSPVPGDPLEVIQTDAPWSARAGGLLRIAWVPLVLVLVTRAISGW